MILSANLDNYFNDYFSVSENSPYFNVEFVDEIEQKYLKYLLGVDSFLELKNDLINGIAQSDKWKNFINGVVYEKNNKQIEYKGIIALLQGFVYYEIYKLQNSIQTSIGNYRADARNAKQVNSVNNEKDYLLRYNNSVMLYQSAINYLNDNNTKISRVVTSSMKIGDVYTITANTDYLLTNSRVRINNKDYTVSNITAVTFDITEANAITITDFAFYLYNNVEYSYLENKQQISY